MSDSTDTVRRAHAGGLDRRRLLRAMVSVGALPVGLAGCSLNDLLRSEKDVPQLFLLTPKSTFRADLPRIASQLVIETPIASEGLDTHRIALRRSPLTLDYFARARWTERAPQLVQTLLVESFENTDRIVSVARDGTDLRSDFTLKTELREFQAEYVRGEKEPIMRVRLNAKIVALPRRSIIASHTVEQQLPASGTKIEAIIDAFDNALGKVMRNLVEWTLLTIAAHNTERR